MSTGLANAADRARIWLLSGADVAGRLLGLHMGARREVARVFPQLSLAGVWRLAAATERHRAVTALLRRERRWWGEAWLERAVEVRGKEVLARNAGRPIVVVTWHAGLATAVTAALAQCGRSGVLLRFDRGAGDKVHGFTELETGRHPQRRAQALLQAIAALRQGQTAVFAAGVIRPSGRADDLVLPFLGRYAHISPGAAALARLGGAALVPAVCQLHAGRIVVELFEPLPVGPHDHDTTRRIAAFFEPRFAAAPELLWRCEIVHLARAPRVVSG